jgi:adenosylcobinamide kinase/adenosylcobinamide-phosphate guanylyltransferase
MPATIYLVTGGARSGKSSYAEGLCGRLSANPIYLATSSSKFRDGDDDFAQRIQKHQRDRQNSGCDWTTIEEPVQPSLHADQFSGQVVLVDCLTLWLTNYLLEEGAFSISEDESNNTVVNNSNNDKEITAAVDRALTNIKQEFDKLTQPYNITFVFVTNEVGSGTHSTAHLTRKFVDAQGWFNQFVARKANQVIHMVSGVPNLIKNDFTKTVADLQERTEEAGRLDRHLSARGLPMDAKGYFFVKLIDGLIVASFHSCMLNDQGEVCDLNGNKIKCSDKGCSGKSAEPMKVWKCRTAKELTTEIFERWDDVAKVQLSVGHAAYIGREAQKAEHALLSGTKFQQD